ncbi:MAG TPA: hypothetical protein VMW04_03885 [Patescibacteria group bacterium]|nr:hypothetical protein [Patescibacteria group bacterium]
MTERSGVRPIEAVQHCLLNVILTNLRETEPAVAEALRPRSENGQNDVEMAYSLVAHDIPDDPTRHAKGIAISLDIILRNHGVSLEERQRIMGEYRGLCGRYLGLKSEYFDRLRQQDLNQ